MEKAEVLDAIEYIRKYKSESNRIEVKAANGGFPRCYDTLSSFSNKYGGVIIFGIDENNDFDVTGVYDLNDLQKKISSLCNDSMEPIIRPDMLSIEFEGKKILAVKVEEISQNKKPCYYKPKGLKGGSYTRIGDSDSQMTDYEIYALQCYKDYIFEDVRPNKRATLDDLNKKSLEEYINRIKLTKTNFAKNDFNVCLKLSGIIDNSEDNIYPTLAGTLIFSDYPQCFYPQLFIACSVIPGPNLGDIGPLGERFLDNERIEGTIEEMLKGSMRFLQRNMKTSVIINSEGKRTNRSEYPMEALREAIANALIHRDYSNQTERAYISVYMYSDRIEIINPGALYGPNKIEKLGTATTMEVRNTTIVRILEEKGAVIENRHTGILTMRREMKNHGLPDPEFYEERDCFKVIFRNTNAFHTGTQNGTQNETQITSDELDKIKLIILDYCKEPKTSEEIRKYINMKAKSTFSRNIIRPLISEGKLNYTNKNSVSAKNQKYITIKK